MHQDLVLIGGARTAMTEYVGTPGYGLFKDVSANELGAHAIRAALERAGVPAARLQHGCMGNAMQTSADAIYGARHAALRAGIPIETPALTVNRLCGSGIQYLISAAHRLLAREHDVVVAGGDLPPSTGPHLE